MIPGYVGERSVPYYSPIYVNAVEPRKTGKSILRLDFLNVLYAQGVQDFRIDIRVLKRAKDFLVGELIDVPGEDTGRVAIISHIEFSWIERFCPNLWYHRPPSSTSHGTDSVSDYLDEVFFDDRGRPGAGSE